MGTHNRCCMLSVSPVIFSNSGGTTGGEGGGGAFAGTTVMPVIGIVCSVVELVEVRLVVLPV